MIPWYWAWLPAEEIMPATGEAKWPLARTAVLVQMLESFKTAPSLIDRTTIFCNQGGTHWVSIPMLPHQPIDKSQSTRSPYYTKQPGLGRHSVVVPVPSSIATSKPLTLQDDFCVIIKHIGLPPIGYNTNNLRIGAATTAAAAGIPVKTMKQLGW